MVGLVSGLCFQFMVLSGLERSPMMSLTPILSTFRFYGLALIYGLRQTSRFQWRVIMSRIEMATPKDWQARHDLEVLLQASKIRKDSARMKAVKAMAQKNKAEKVEELTEVSELAEGHKE